VPPGSVNRPFSSSGGGGGSSSCMQGRVIEHLSSDFVTYTQWMQASAKRTCIASVMGEFPDSISMPNHEVIHEAGCHHNLALVLLMLMQSFYYPFSLSSERATHAAQDGFIFHIHVLHHAASLAPRDHVLHIFICCAMTIVSLLGTRSLSCRPSCSCSPLPPFMPHL
jgi:hypothetical protein